MSTSNDKPNSYEHAVIMIDQLRAINAELLKTLINTIETLAYVHGENWETVKKARAVIAKAKGEG